VVRRSRLPAKATTLEPGEYPLVVQDPESTRKSVSVLNLPALSNEEIAVPAYAAALFDSYGHIDFHLMLDLPSRERYITAGIFPHWRRGLNDERNDIITWLKEKFGGRPNTDSTGAGRYWLVHREPAVEFLKIILPFVISSKPAIQLAIARWETVDSEPERLNWTASGGFWPNG
jgi:hypothetical protein